MRVVFSAWDYFGSMLLWILAPIVLYLLISLPLIRFLRRKVKNTGLSLLPMLLIVPLMILEFTFVVPAGAQTECLYPRENAYTHTTAGIVDAVRPADHIPLYFYQGEFRGGVYVTMEGVEYYSMAHPMLQEGVALHFTYCPEENLIMAFSPIAAEDVTALQKPFLGPDPIPAQREPAPKLQSVIGTLCFWTGFLAFGLLIRAEDWIIPRLTVHLLARDREQRGEVIPNPAAAAISAGPALSVGLIALGGILASNSLMLLIVLIPGVLGAVFSPRFCAARMRLEGRNIRVRRFFRERTVPLSTLRAAYWDRKQIDLSPRRLVLVFDGWSLELDQISHLGLEDLHRRLSALLSITH